MRALKNTILIAIFVTVLFLSLGVGIYANRTQLQSTTSLEDQLKPLNDSKPRTREAIAEAAPKDKSINYDVAVFGGTPEGIAAAVSSSRHGLKVCLISEKDSLGGVWAKGELNQMDNTYKLAGGSTTETAPYYIPMSQGFNESFMKLLGVRKMENGFYDGVFDVDKVVPLFERLIKDNKIDHALFTAFKADAVDRRITSVELKSGVETKRISATYFVDASENGDLAAKVGCPFTLGRGQSIYGTTDTPVNLPEDDYGADERQMAATLMFKLGGVSWDYLSNAPHNDDIDKFARSGNAGWGYNVLAPGFNTAQSLSSGVMLRGLNLGRQSDGSVLVNGLLIYNVNGTLWASVQDGTRRAKEQIPYIIGYLRAKAPAFRDAYLIDTADTLYVRETRHFVGEYILTLDDIMSNAQPYDTIALANHAVDEHPYTPEEALQNLQKYGTLVDLHLQPKLYGIPLRSLLPMSIDNLALVGRTISATPKAAASARVISIGISEGQAIGEILSIAKQQGRPLKNIAYDQSFWATNALEVP